MRDIKKFKRIYLVNFNKIFSMIEDGQLCKLEVMKDIN